MEGTAVIPLLDLVEALEERDGDEDGDGLLAVADLDLYSKNWQRSDLFNGHICGCFFRLIK